MVSFDHICNHIHVKMHASEFVISNCFHDNQTQCHDHEILISFILGKSLN